MWGDSVRSIYEKLVYLGARKAYSNYLTNLDINLVKQIVGNMDLSEYNFKISQNGQNSHGVEDDTWTVIGYK